MENVSQNVPTTMTRPAVPVTNALTVAPKRLNGASVLKSVRSTQVTPHAVPRPVLQNAQARGKESAVIEVWKSVGMSRDVVQINSNCSLGTQWLLKVRGE